MTCPKCHESPPDKVLTILGVEKHVRGECACDRNAAMLHKRRNPQALRRLVDELSTFSTEFATAEFGTHPHPKARHIGNWFMGVMPDPLHEILDHTDWFGATPDDRTWLTARGRQALKGAPSLYLWGLQGRGKTGLAYSILRALRARGIVGVGANVRLLMEDTKARYSDRSLGPVERLFSPLRNAPMLLLDDLDKANPESANELSLLYGLAESRTEAKLPTIITANRNMTDMVTMFSDKFGQTGAAIMDRFAQPMLRPVEMVAEQSYRLVKP